jgi:hypothetical protein
MSSASTVGHLMSVGTTGVDDLATRIVGAAVHLDRHGDPGSESGGDP